MDRPIPAFYACYLLRSTIRHQNLYVGSTPHPVRRLRQHNGIAKGGAVRTSRDTLRPWEMTCLVTGFPSKIAALQFEWAWQNTHQTRHIAPDERITQANTKQRYSPRSGKVRKRLGRPRMSMQDKLANLHILLRANSFERWPLKVRFFAEDVHKMWHRWTVNMPEVVRHGIEIEMDESILDKASLEDDPLQPVGIYLIDPTYQHMKTTLEKSTKLLDAPQNSCAICSTLFDSTKVMALVCSNSECDASFHVACLSHQFLKGENALAAVVPTQGDCPTCRSSLNWSDLVKDLSLRIRGEKEVAALFKVPKRRKGGSKEEVIVPVVEEDEDEDMEEPSAVADESEADVDYDDVLVQSDYEDIDRVQATPSGGDGWKLIDDMDEQGLPGAVVAAMSLAGKGRREFVEDSDWDEAEVIE